MTVNLSKSGPSVSVGPRGAKMTFGHGRVRQTVGLPGTGLYATRITPATSAPSPATAYAGVGQTEAAPAPEPAEAVDDGQALHFGWPLVIAVGAGILVAGTGGTFWQAVDVAAVAWVCSLLYEWLAHHHPVTARLLVHLAIAAAAIAATVATLVVAVGVGVLFAGAKANRRR